MPSPSLRNYKGILIGLVVVVVYNNLEKTGRAASKQFLPKTCRIFPLKLTKYGLLELLPATLGGCMFSV